MQNFTTMFSSIIAHTRDPTAIDNSTLNTYFFGDISDIRVGDVVWPFTAVCSAIDIESLLLASLKKWIIINRYEYFSSRWEHT